MNLSQTAEDHDKDQPFAAHLNVRTYPSVDIPPASAGSFIMLSLVLLLQQPITHLPPAMVLVLSIGLGAVSYSVFIWLTQKEEDRGDQAVNLSLKGLWRYALVNERGD